MDPPTANATAGVPATTFYKSKDGIERHGQNLCVDDYDLFLEALFRSSNFHRVREDELNNEHSDFYVSERRLGTNLIVYVKNRRSDTTLYIPGYSKFAVIKPLYDEIMATISPFFRVQYYEMAGAWTRKILMFANAYLIESRNKGSSFVTVSVTIYADNDEEGLVDSRRIAGKLPDDEETCAICYEQMDGTESRAACSHGFHHRCICRWLQQNSSCPLCRREVVSLTAVR